MRMSRARVTRSARSRRMVSGWTSGDGYIYDACTGDYLTNLDQTGDLVGPMAVVRGPDQNLYVASELNDRVIRYDGRTGAMIDFFVWDDPATAGFDESMLEVTPPELPP